MPHFVKPAEYAVYGGPEGGAIKRVSGYDTLEQARAGVELHRRAVEPGWVYSIWQANGWREVK